jgi:hypothetical protein
MQKRKRYHHVKFDSDVIQAADKALRALTSEKVTYSSLDVEYKGAQWSFDTFEEFLAAADQGVYVFNVYAKGVRLTVDEHSAASMMGVSMTGVTVSAPTREQIESIFAVFDGSFERCRLPEPPQEPEPPPPDTKVFIAHGHDPQWRDLKDHLHESTTT